MFSILVRNRQEEVQLGLGHCLDDEFFVVAEEEETSASTCALSSLEDLLSILFWTKTLYQNAVISQIAVKCIDERPLLVELHHRS